MSKRLLSKNQFSMYEDFATRTVTKADVATNYDFAVWNKTITTEVPQSVPAVAEGHPGLIRLGCQNVATVQHVQFRFGQAMQLKDCGRVAATLRMNGGHPNGSTGLNVGLFGSLAGFPNDNVSFWTWQENASWAVAIGSVNKNGVETGEVGNYGKATLPQDLLLADWLSFDIRMRYSLGLVDFYINGKLIGALRPHASLWTTELKPMCWVVLNNTMSVDIDEVGVAPADYDLQSNVEESQVSTSVVLERGATDTTRLDRY
jgi:hypothetical protein